MDALAALSTLTLRAHYNPGAHALDALAHAAAPQLQPGGVPPLEAFAVLQVRGFTPLRPRCSRSMTRQTPWREKEGAGGSQLAARHSGSLAKRRASPFFRMLPISLQLCLVHQLCRPSPCLSLLGPLRGPLSSELHAHHATHSWSATQSGLVCYKHWERWERLATARFPPTSTQVLTPFCHNPGEGWLERLTAATQPTLDTLIADWPEAADHSQSRTQVGSPLGPFPWCSCLAVSSAFKAIIQPAL